MGLATMGIRNKPGFKLPPNVAATSALVPHSLPHRSDVIAHLATLHDWRLGAELGVWDGRTTRRVIDMCPRLRMIGVDLWAPQPGNDGPEDYVGWDHAAHEAAARRLPADRVTLIKAHTTEAVKRIENESLDFVFFDADHGRRALERDLQDWWFKLRPKGWAIGHDINWPTVRAALDNWLIPYEVGPDNTWFCPKEDL